MRGDETPGWIVTNFYTGVGVHDVITCADLYYDCLRGLGVAGGSNIGFLHWLASSPLQFALPCECVIDQWNDSRNCLCNLVSNPDHTSYYHCWAGCCECATAVQFFKVTKLLCLVGNKSDSSGKYYSSPVPPSCTAVNNMPCTFIGFYSFHPSITFKLGNLALAHCNK